MQWFYNFSTKVKILLLTVFMLVLMSVVGAIGIIKMGELDAADTLMYEREALGISYIKEATIDMLYAGRASRNFLLSQQDARLEAQHHFDAVKKYEQQMEENLRIAEPLLLYRTR